jgi:hypothetical protein
VQAAREDGKVTSTTICEVIFPDGDKVLNKFTLAPDGSAIRESVAGTGKYEGIVSSGTARTLGPFPTIKAGTYQSCNAGVISVLTPSRHRVQASEVRGQVGPGGDAEDRADDLSAHVIAEEVAAGDRGIQNVERGPREPPLAAPTGAPAPIERPTQFELVINAKTAKEARTLKCPRSCNS